MHRVLIADDDVELCDLLSQFLCGQGFAVACVHDGEAAVQRAAEHDAVVLDVMMPKRDGFEALREIRVRSRVPIIMLTARGEDVDRIVGLEMGADDYLPKPCNPRELAARIRAVLRRAGPGDDPDAKGGPLTVGDIVLDAGTRRVERDGVPVELTSAEFNVLAALLASAGQIVTKADLTERGLGRRLERFDRSIDVHLSNLRRKLGPGPDGEPRIETVRSIGYLYRRTSAG